MSRLGSSSSNISKVNFPWHPSCGQRTLSGFSADMEWFDQFVASLITHSLHIRWLAHLHVGAMGLAPPISRRVRSRCCIQEARCGQPASPPRHRRIPAALAWTHHRMSRTQSGGVQQRRREKALVCRLSFERLPLAALGPPINSGSLIQSDSMGRVSYAPS